MANIRYKNALAEVDRILQNADEELVEQIPTSVKQFIEENKNIEYHVQIDNTKPLEEQEILPETRSYVSVDLQKLLGNRRREKRIGKK